MKYFSIGSDNYEIDHFGVIHHTNPQPFTYDKSYVSTYDTPQYRKNSEILQALRLGFVLASHGTIPKSLIDMGYGNGDFLRMADRIIPRVYGCDVSGVEVPGIDTGSELKAAEVITFWDCLEHIPNLSFLHELPCQTVVISLPFCHFHELGLDWFIDWKHRKPNEHLHHFNPESLALTMDYYGWENIAISGHEDIIRTGSGMRQNILTMSFKRP